jgi:hypothetical protein
VTDGSSLKIAGAECMHGPVSSACIYTKIRNRHVNTHKQGASQTRAGVGSKTNSFIFFLFLIVGAQRVLSPPAFISSGIVRWVPFLSADCMLSPGSFTHM